MASSMCIVPQRARAQRAGVSQAATPVSSSIAADGVAHAALPDYAKVYTSVLSCPPFDARASRWKGAKSSGTGAERLACEHSARAGPRSIPRPSPGLARCLPGGGRCSRHVQQGRPRDLPSRLVRVCRPCAQAQASPCVQQALMPPVAKNARSVRCRTSAALHGPPASTADIRI